MVMGERTVAPRDGNSEIDGEDGKRGQRLSVRPQHVGLQLSAQQLVASGAVEVLSRATAADPSRRIVQDKEEPGQRRHLGGVCVTEVGLRSTRRLDS